MVQKVNRRQANKNLIRLQQKNIVFGIDFLGNMIICASLGFHGAPGIRGRKGEPGANGQVGKEGSVGPCPVECEIGDLGEPGLPGDPGCSGSPGAYVCHIF